MNVECGPDRSLDSELEALIAELRRARQGLDRGGNPEIGGLLPRLKQVTTCLNDRQSGSNAGKPALLLALADELKRTIGAFSIMRDDLREELQTASRNMMAGAAYRRLSDG